MIFNVLHVFDINVNLLSIKKLLNINIEIVFYKKKLCFNLKQYHINRYAKPRFVFFELLKRQ